MLSPEQARDLVNWAGSQRRAAREVGVAQSTVYYWLNPDSRMTTQERLEWARERYHTDPEWRERKLAQNRAIYHSEDTLRRARRLLRQRRNKALQRRAKRSA